MPPTLEDAASIVMPSGRRLDLSRPGIMGVLNVTPDSFSDGGRFVSVASAVDHALTIERQGAAIIDIGGESTRPGAEPVPEQEEMERVVPVIEAVRKESDLPISVDTYKAPVAEMALQAGADMVNDISALRFSPGMASLVAATRVPVVLMHMLGMPRNMQEAPRYDNCIREIGQFFEERLAYCDENGIARKRVILDPGIGFGKRLSDNLEILCHLDVFRRLGRPLLVGPSRKSFIGMIHDSRQPADKRLGGSLAAAVIAVGNGATIVRVHDVVETAEALRVLEAVEERS